MKLHIDDIDEDVFLNLEAIEFAGCKFDDIRFENYKDESQNVFLNTIIRPKGYNSPSNIKNKKYPLLKFNDSQFGNIKIENANSDLSPDRPMCRCFHYGLAIDSCEFLSSIKLSVIVFHKNVEIKSSIFKEQVEFFKIDFKGEFTISGISKTSVFEKDFILVSTVFEKRVEIKNTIFKGDNKSLELIGVNFKDSFILEHNVKFEKKVGLSGKFNEVAFSGIFEESLSLTKCKFEKKLQVTNAVFNGGFILNWSSSKEEKEFNQEIIFKNIIFNKHFSMYKCLFKAKVDFEEVSFKEKINLKTAKFELIEFKNVSFEKEFEVSKDTFTQDELIFEKVNFNLFKCDDKEFFKKELKFKDCEFQQIHEFKDLTLNKISFNTCRFNDNVYFNNSTFEGYADFHES